MPTKMICTKGNEWANVVINDENKATVAEASSKDFSLYVDMFFEVAGTSQKRKLLGVRMTETGEREIYYGESDEEMSHEAFVHDSSLRLAHLGIKTEIETLEYVEARQS